MTEDDAFEPLFQMEGVTKRFGALIANDSVSLSVMPGEVLGLLGENGAGKTTLMNVAFGLYRPEAGRMFMGGQPITPRTSADAIRAGIGMVHQHAHLAEGHSAIENLLAGQPGRRGMLDRAGMLRKLEEVRATHGLWLPPDKRVAELAVGERQRLDIIRSLVRGARLLILDEPTSVLTPPEIEGLFGAVASLAAEGTGIVFISHKLNEVRRICRRVVVMRHGRVEATLVNDGTLSNAGLARLMCGREPERAERRPAKRGGAVLAAEGLQLPSPGGRARKPPPFDLTVHRGEILGLAGVSGNGQVPLAETLAGMRLPVAGRVLLDGTPLPLGQPARVTEAGLAYVPEDRIGVGMVGRLSVCDNMMLTASGRPRFSRGGWFRPGSAERFAREQIAKYDVRPPDPWRRAGLLSGGNQQKAVVARALAFEPKLLVIAQPTRGLDVASAAFVHRAILALRDAGGAVIVLSDDLDEVFLLSDRIAVMFDQSIVRTFAAEEATVSSIGLAMTGAIEEEVA